MQVEAPASPREELNSPTAFAERVHATLQAKLKRPRRGRGRTRGLASQRDRRESEAAHRGAVVDFVQRTAAETGTKVRELVAAIGLSLRTVVSWCAQRAKPKPPKPRGRRPRQSTVAARNGVIAFLRESGPHVGVPTLVAHFPTMARRALEDLKRRHVSACLQRERVYAEALTWTIPGSVWAMDFTQVESQPLDGAYPYLFVVRDLASGDVIMALPIRRESAITCTRALTVLFELYGPPLVLKADNGAAFVAEESRYLASQWGVTLLYSPPGTPSFNGSCEAGMGGLKTRAHHVAARRGRPGAWTCDDVEAARQQCNLLGRPNGPHGPTPDQVWRERPALAAGLRQAFRATVLEHQASERTKLGHASGDQLSHADQAQVDRQAIRRALVEHGLLRVEGRWIPLRNKR